MRILYDSKALERPGGGIYEYAFQLLRALSAHKDTELFVQMEADRLPQALADHVTPLGNYRFRGWRGYQLEGVYAEWLCRRHHLDMYHSLYYTPKPRTRIPFAATCYDFIWERYPEQFTAAKDGVPRLKAATLERADRVLSISEATRRDCETYMGRSEGVSTVYLGKDQRFVPKSRDASSGARDTYGLPRPYLLFTGTRYGYKNFSRLYQAFEREGLADRFDLVCVGHHDHITPHEKKEWAKACTEPPAHLKLLGYVSEEERIELIRDAFALAYPSLYEGFGIPVLEALTAGVPVICSNQSSLPEVGGGAVEYVDPYDVEDIARGLQAVTRLDKDARTRRIQAGCKQAERFSWERCAEETYSVYQEIVERGKIK